MTFLPRRTRPCPFLLSRTFVASLGADPVAEDVRFLDIRVAGKAVFEVEYPKHEPPDGGYRLAC